MSESNSNKTLIIHNPRAGVKRKVKFADLVVAQGFTPENGYEYAETAYGGHASEMAKEARTKGYATIAVAGGDGTVNEVARELIHSETTLAIVPMGSGNGLARHMKVPLDLEKALELLKSDHYRKIDVGDANGHKFFCAAGIGFDAVVSKAFESSKVRGMHSYIALGAKSYLQYKSRKYDIIIDGESQVRDAFLISIANADQFGNEAFISPGSKIDDGLLEVCVIKPYPVIQGVALFRSLFTGKIHKNAYYSRKSGKEIKIKLDKKSLFHCDGEVFKAREEINISLEAQALKIRVVRE